MEKLKVQIINKSSNPLPQYATEGSAGLDLRASLQHDITLTPMSRALIPTGVYIGLPVGYEAQVRPRSGLAVNYGITVLNTPGTIDADYQGEICVCLVNLSNNNFTVCDGERIAQMVISKHETVEFELIDKFDTVTERGEGGFGHTGTK